jgi:ABC-2 type transport system ATP-binding protein
MSIEVRQLSRLYGNQKAVDQIDFEVGAGQVVGFLGPNGAGKTTTMKILTCYIPQSSGTVKVCGHDVSEAPLEVRKSVGYLPEHNPLYKDMYITEYLRYVAGFYNLGGKAKSKVEELIELTGLSLERRKRIGQLSKGYRQRVGLAQAMLHDPEVLILDEPTSGLDPNQLADIRALIRKIGEQKTVLFSTHIMQEVQAICDRVVIINRGKIVEDAELQELKIKHAPENSVLATFKEPVKAEQINAVQGVSLVSEAGKGSWKISSDQVIDLREAVFRFAAENKLTLLELRQSDYSLEEVFKKLTEG